MHETIRVSHAVKCPMDYDLLSDRGQLLARFKLMKNYHFLIFLAVWGLSPKFLGWSKSRLSDLLAFPIDFNLHYDQGQQEGVLKPTKNDHFQVFLVVWVLFLRFWCRLLDGIY